MFIIFFYVASELLLILWKQCQFTPGNHIDNQGSCSLYLAVRTKTSTCIDLHSFCQFVDNMSANS
jgi:hypothetical protein